MPELDTILNKLLGEENSKGLSQMELIISRLRSKAKAGNLKAAEILLERAYGKAKQPISIEDSEVKIVVTAKQPPKK